MPIPQVNDRIKEAPAVMLRAVFAGVGQLLLAADKVRARAGQSWPPDRAAAKGQAPAQSRWHTLDEPGPVAQPRERAAAHTQPAATRPVTQAEPEPAPRAAGSGPAASAPPLPGYDDLTLPSIRARMRVMDAGTIRALVAYEKGHARRDDVIAMLERRLAKITAG